MVSIVSKKKKHLPGPKGDREQYKKMRDFLQHRHLERHNTRPEIVREIKDGRKHMLSA